MYFTELIHWKSWHINTQADTISTAIQDYVHYEDTLEML